jgi:dipeptidyl aminopeptidase/acylaminoacyl peptidase
VIAPYGGYLNKALTETYFLDALLRELLGAGWQVIRPNTLGLPQTSGYGRVQLRDTERLVDTLATAGLLAPDRVGVIGHSHGGSMAYYYATHSSRFCAVVAINGRADWVMQAQHEGDGLLPGSLGATPEADPALYREASPAANAGRVRARLLMVAGQLDGQILPANVRTMADSLRAYGKPVDSLVFMDEGHQIDEPAHRAALWEATQRLLRSGCGT